MQIHEVENLSLEELKARRGDLVEQLADDHPGEVLAERYLQARIDAKIRDKKLADQGETIRTLNEAWVASKQRETDLMQRLTALRQSSAKELEEARNAHSEEVSVLKEQLKQREQAIAALESALTESKKKENRYYALASSSRRGINEAARLLNDLISEYQLDDSANS